MRFCSSSKDGFSGLTFSGIDESLALCCVFSENDCNKRLVPVAIWFNFRKPLRRYYLFQIRSNIACLITYR